MDFALPAPPLYPAAAQPHGGFPYMKKRLKPLVCRRELQFRLRYIEEAGFHLSLRRVAKP